MVGHLKKLSMFPLDRGPIDKVSRGFLSPGTKSWGERMIGQPDPKLEMRGSSS